MGRAIQKTTGLVPKNPLDNLRKGGGRPKGVPNKTTIEIKHAILAALGKAGGIDYLVKQAEANPAAFMQLVGKVLPMQITGEGGGAIVHEVLIRAIEP